MSQPNIIKLAYKLIKKILGLNIHVHQVLASDPVRQLDQAFDLVRSKIPSTFRYEVTKVASFLSRLRCSKALSHFVSRLRCSKALSHLVSRLRCASASSISAIQITMIKHCQCIRLHFQNNTFFEHFFLHFFLDLFLYEYFILSLK